MSEQEIMELRDAVIDAARQEDRCNRGKCDCGIVGGPFCEDVLRDTIRALDDALKPDPLRDAVELLRRVYAARDSGSPMSHLMPEMRAVIAAYDQRDGAG